ncbi:unnamed protein product [Peronospora belbahrii]|uniref:HSF-type DNA-binding domain-containing protein n=1 Tax=Peronospora belbahrii TaxID=622444 RepID=A0AAU9KWT9_9STRA|nr:unnamed protein product [Peronospora belbahrii]CAH0513779.1 unnamed protein product [Peronospora belbahrii]
MSHVATTQQGQCHAQDVGDGNPVKEVAPFLRSLRRMLDTESPYIVRWTPDGNAFEIYDMAAMTNYVLPKYFKHHKYASFQRQLNYFHFRKWTKSRAVVCTFSNQFFQRDQPSLTWRITRKRSLSQTKDLTSRSNVLKHECRAPLALPTPGHLHSKQIDSVLTMQTTAQREMVDEDVSLAWIDLLYPELDLALLDDNGPSNTDYMFSSRLLSL